MSNTFLNTIESINPEIGLVGIPYDGGVSYRPGARFGPEGVRRASSRIRPVSEYYLDLNPFNVFKVADLGDVPLSTIHDCNAVFDDISYFYDSLPFPVITVGGDHSITYPIMSGLRLNKHKLISLIHIDAHCDAYDKFQGSDLSHACPIYHAIDQKLIDPKKSIQLCIRGSQSRDDGWDYVANAGMTTVFMHNYHEINIEEKIRRVVGDNPVYISFDIDALDPVYAPGTGTPEPGGITSLEAIKLLRSLKGLNIIGADLVEIAPDYDTNELTTFTGATLMYEMLCLMVLAKVKRFIK